MKGRVREREGGRSYTNRKGRGEMDRKGVIEESKVKGEGEEREREGAVRVHRRYLVGGRGGRKETGNPVIQLSITALSCYLCSFRSTL